MIAADPNLRRRAAIKIIAISAVGLIAAAAIAAPSLPKVALWNATASVPRGLYWIATDRLPTTGDLAILWLPHDAAELASQRHYLPLDVPLIKPVAAGPGQRVCRADRKISVDGRVIAQTLDRDHIGRPLPVWTGCFRLTQGRLFVMNAAVPTSFDGRYFGPVDANRVIGRAIPLLTEDPATHDYRWRFFTPAS